MPRIAKSLDVLRSQVNSLAPKRSKASDGWIGDPAHASRKSDHNPTKKGVVQALDITHDPKNGMDAHDLAETLRKNRDPRIKYVISNARIFSRDKKPWVWRPYSGTNPHTKHIHVSVEDLASLYDDPKAWDIGVKVVTPPPPDVEPVAPKAKETLPEKMVKLAKSKTQWAATGTFLASVIGALTDWRIWAVIVAGTLAAYIIYERSKKK